jgi:hypothetical protein
MATLGMLRLPMTRLPGRQFGSTADARERALAWLRDHHLPDGGIAVSAEHPKSYPEVTGYLIPTLLEWGQVDLAQNLAAWLIAIQRPDGSFDGPEAQDAPYIFDTGQALRGLLAVIGLVPGAEAAARRAADWLVAQADAQGVLRPLPDSVWSRRFGQRINENIHLYVLPPLVEAADKLHEPGYVSCVARSLAYYKAKPDVVEFKFLTHFFGYVLEALVDLGERDLARAGLRQIIAIQWADGGIPGVPGAGWICSPGTLQLAIVGYKLGEIAFADAALGYVQSLQLPGGGFRGSYGPGAGYGPDAEPSWSIKYFLDAWAWRARARELPMTHLDSLCRPTHRWQRQALAGPLVQEGQRRVRHGDLAGARRALVRAARIQPTVLARRAVASVLIESMIGRSSMGMLRHALVSPRQTASSVKRITRRD